MLYFSDSLIISSSFLCDLRYSMPTADCVTRTCDAKLTRPSLSCMRTMISYNRVYVYIRNYRWTGTILEITFNTSQCSHIKINMG